jgi:hypothetical protein
VLDGLCLIFLLVVDLFRHEQRWKPKSWCSNSRFIVLRRGKPNRMPFWLSQVYSGLGLPRVPEGPRTLAIVRPDGCVYRKPNAATFSAWTGNTLFLRQNSLFLRNNSLFCCVGNFAASR